MRVYYFRCYWPWNILFVVRCVTYISNLRKIGQKLRSLSRVISTWDRRTDGQTNTQVILYLFNAMHCIGQTITYAPYRYNKRVTISTKPTLPSLLRRWRHTRSLSLQSIWSHDKLTTWTLYATWNSLLASNLTVRADFAVKTNRFSKGFSS